MNDSSKISNQPPTSSLITQGVEKLARLQPITKLGQITRKIVDLTSFKSTIKARNEVIHTQIHEVTKCAAVVLESLPEDLRDAEALRKKLKEDGDYKVVSNNGTVLSHQDLERFCNDMEVLFTKIYPKVKEGAFYIKDAVREAKKMPKIVQEYLSPEIKRLRKEKENSDKTSDQEHRTRRKIAKGRLAIDAGHGIKRNKGATGTLIIKDINGKSVGVHKVSEKDVPLMTRLKNLIKSIFGGQLTYLSKKNLAQPLSERAAYFISEGLGFDVAPPSSRTTMKGIVGVFQIFLIREKKDQGIATDVKAAMGKVEERPEEKQKDMQSDVNYPKGKGPNDYIEAKDILPSLDQKSVFTESEKTKFQQFALFDFIIGNLDRHEENWFVTVSTNNELTSIQAIDNANAFPKKQPRKSSMATKNQYKWQTLNLAKQQFTSETIKFVRESLSQQQIEFMILKLKQDVSAFLDADMERLLVKRARVAYNLVLKEDQTPAALAACSTEEDMDDFFSSFPIH